MENFNAPFRFDYVGSFLRPAHLKQAREEIVSIIEKKYGLTLKQEPVELE